MSAPFNLQDFTAQLNDWGVYENSVHKLQEALSGRSDLSEGQRAQIIEHFFEELAYEARNIVVRLMFDGGIDDFEFEEDEQD
jgi:hypothetical protein